MRGIQLAVYIFERLYAEIRRQFFLRYMTAFYGFLQYPKQAPILPIFRFYAFCVQLTRNKKTEELKRKPYIKCAYEF